MVYMRYNNISYNVYDIIMLAKLVHDLDVSYLQCTGLIRCF